MTAMDWNSNIEDDGREYTLLPTGDYPFTVVKFEKGYFEGSAKVGPCPRADLTLAIEHDGKTVNLQTQLLLDRAFEWKIGGFFVSIGEKRKGEKLKMNWAKVLGAKGVAHVNVNKWTDRNGNERENNNVAYFVAPKNSDGDDEFEADNETF